MESLKFFNLFYEKNGEWIYSKSLLDFFEMNVRSRLPSSGHILELGCGSYSLFEVTENLNFTICAIDFAKKAIAKAPISKISYKTSSVVDPDFFLDSSYHLVFDSHCLNCLADHEERFLAFENIYKSLKVGGLFASELMVQPGDEKIEIPFKLIKQAHELEAEIISHGLKILFFMVVKGSQFINGVDGKKMSCDVLRVIAQK